jgi:ribosomal protein S18 acetylase RimI-like enzyme
MTSQQAKTFIKPVAAIGITYSGRMASRWATYEAGGGRSTALTALEIRPAMIADCPDVAAITHERDRVAVSDAQLRCELDLADGSRLLLVARVEGEVVAFGRAAHWNASSSAPANSAPSGWYRFGVIVRDRWRRHGIGTELTRRRVTWISERAGTAYYFANARNRASIDLHEKLGFVEITRDFSFPGASFEGDEGILFRVDLQPQPIIPGGPT